jgi:hypothetical protein
MDMFNFGKKNLSQLLVMIFIISGCMPSDVPSTQKALQTPGKLGSVTSGAGAGAGETEDDTTETSLPPKVEIRHLIEPNLSTDLTYSTGTGYAGGGSYVRKLTLPKNFAGRLYVAGINIGTLSARFVKVRFKFGVNREAVTIPATVTQAPGITPNTNINVLVLDLRSEPFRNIRLPYDLFDYNEYTTNPDGTLASGVEPTQDNRDTGLYCRGLRVEDDPTFQGVGACDGAQSQIGQPDEECLYSYAKVLDQGLIKQSGSVKVPLSPSFPQIKSVTGSNYFQDYMNQKILKPLPDTMVTTSSNIAGNFRFSDVASPVNSSDSVAVTFSNWAVKSFAGSNYYYRGPYRLVNSTDWQFKFPELDGEKRLFRKNSWVAYDPAVGGPLTDDNQTFPTQYRLYYNSYLFPLATKLSLNANVTHLASTQVDGTRTEQALSVAGKTLWMDGANARAQSRNTDLEHIGSCNVSATMEILAKDDNNIEYVVSIANDVKLQLVRPTQYKTDTGNEVLYTNFKSCNSNTGCGGSECCFNNRCWDDSLVSQCLENNSTQGNRIIGESCASDMECSSLCCNRTSGQCAPHNSELVPAVLCSKPIGDSCIAKEWCAKSTIRKCLVVKTGTDSNGNVTCRQHCYNSEEYGNCTAGTCTPPVQEAIATFDPNAAGACNNAVPAPNF